MQLIVRLKEKRHNAIRSAGTVSHIYNMVAKEQSSNAIIAMPLTQ